MAYDSGNIFAKILRGEADAAVVLDEEHCMAFMDVMPQSPGHTLVIPRQPAENLFDLDDDAWTELMATTRRVAHAVQAAFQPAGMMLMQLNGPGRGADGVPHPLPRRPAVRGGGPRFPRAVDGGPGGVGRARGADTGGAGVWITAWPTHRCSPRS